LPWRDKDQDDYDSIGLGSVQMAPSSLNMAETYLTVAEIAQLLKVNQQTIRSWIDRRELAAVRVGSRRVRIKQSDLDGFLEDAETIIPKDEQQPAGADQVEAAEPELLEQLGAALENARRAVSEGDNGPKHAGHAGRER
jgi:excisionase family DNA binding protein